MHENKREVENVQSAQESNAIKQNSSKCSKIISTLNLKIFMNGAFVIICMNNALMTFGLSVVFVHLSSFGLYSGLTNQEATLLFSALGISLVAGKIISGLLGQLPFLSSICLYTGGFFFSAVAIAFMPLFHSFMPLLICSGLFGALIGCYGIHLPQVISS